MIHAAAAGADELLAVGQHLHQFFERGMAMVGAQQGEREGHEQGGRGGEPGGGRKIGFDHGIDAAAESPPAGDGLGGGAQVVLPIAGGDGRQAARSIRRRVRRRRALAARMQAVRARREADADGAAQRNGEDGQVRDNRCARR